MKEDLTKEFNWLAGLIEGSFERYFNPSEAPSVLLAPPELSMEEGPYAALVCEYKLDADERKVLALALVPHFRPEILDVFFTQNPQLGRPFTEFGGAQGKYHRGFLPTGQTAAFLLDQGRTGDRGLLAGIYRGHHKLAREEFLSVQGVEEGEPWLSGALLPGVELLERVSGTVGAAREARGALLGSRLRTEMEWEDLVVSHFVLKELNMIRLWIEHEKILMEDPVFQKHIKPGFRSLFYGPPGTGKTLSASLLGKSCGLEVFRIDLSLIVSKYIGETEKNLGRIFDTAEKRNWILFFDEADALFGKRTQTKSSNDRYANQEVSYLLQRVEDYPGVIILASNLKSNMDEAFTRRFQSMIHFPMPDARQREKLWRKIFEGRFQPEPSIDLTALGEQYELSGGSMINVFRYVSLKAVARGGEFIREKDLTEGIRREFQKYGKTI